MRTGVATDTTDRCSNIEGVLAEDVKREPGRDPDSKPNIAAIYTHGNFEKALDAQRVFMDQLLKSKSASESTQ